jgi:hypothetical protein
MPLLDDAKTALRISLTTTAFDTEVTDLIAAARHDLQLSGVLAAKVNDDTDPLIRRAVFVYVKANFGFDNPDAEKLQNSYNLLKMHLTLSLEYTGSGVGGGGTSFAIKNKTFIATAGQTVFSISDTGTYVTGKNYLRITIGGVLQYGNFTETNATSFTMDAGVDEGVEVFAEWFEGVGTGG